MKSTKWVGSVAMLAGSLLATYAQTPEAPVAGAPAVAQAVAPENLSPSAAEVAKLATSGVGDEVVLAYVKNSQAPFNLSADDVLYLKDIGLSPEVTSAMLSHDSALRDQPPQYAPAATNPAPSAAAVAPAPAVQPAPAPAPTVAAAPAPVYVSSPPPEVTYFYNDLAPYGTWVQLDGYGWCWQPTAVVVTPGWRPYCHGGNWVYSDLGWYWQSTYSWGWAPFHYGRWQLHPRCGWVWLPDRVWGPAWVTWRTAGDTCGWAPLPPHAVFDVRLGWRYNGVAVGASFGFNLGSDAFLFVSFGDFCSRDLYRRSLPPARVTTVYHQTTVINNYVVNNNRIVHRGIPIERVSAAGYAPVPRATVRDWSDRPDRMPTRAGSVVYRPHLEAPAQPVHMEAQRIDPQHPVIRHSPSGPPRAERVAVSGREAQAPGGAPPRQTLAAPRLSPWSSSAKAESSRPIQSPPSTPRATQATPSGKARPTSDWSRDTRPATAPQIQPTPSAPPTTPATPAGRAPRTSSGSHDASATAAPRIQSTPGASLTEPTMAGAQAPGTSISSRGTKSASAPQIDPSPTTRQPVLTMPPGPAAPRAPEEWKQGARAAPSYRSDAGLPALYNVRPAGQSPAATTQSSSLGRNAPAYQPKGHQQAAEIRSLPQSSQRASAPPSSPANNSDTRSRKSQH